MRGHVRNADARTFWLLLLAAVGLTGCDRMTYWVNKGYMDKIEKKPHTAHIFDYAVTFPRPSEIQDQIPGGLESGIGWFMFNPANEDGNYTLPYRTGRATTMMQSQVRKGFSASTMPHATKMGALSVCAVSHWARQRRLKT